MVNEQSTMVQKLFYFLVVNIISTLDFAIVGLVCGWAILPALLLLIPHLLAGSTYFKEKAADLVKQVNNDAEND